MRKTLLFATLALLFFGAADAQRPLHYWNDGPLSLNDFGYPQGFSINLQIGIGFIGGRTHAE